jgi:hypothetical protein
MAPRYPGLSCRRSRGLATIWSSCCLGGQSGGHPRGRAAPTLPQVEPSRQRRTGTLEARMFIRPRLCTSLRDPSRLDDPRYMAEPKFDGQRAQVHVAGRRTVETYSRAPYHFSATPDSRGSATCDGLSPKRSSTVRCAATPARMESYTFGTLSPEGG